MITHMCIYIYISVVQYMDVNEHSVSQSSYTCIYTAMAQYADHQEESGF